MSKQKNKIATAAKLEISAPAAKAFSIKYPLLWLIAITVLLYISSMQFGFTELDDSIFIRDLHRYNEDFTNLLTSFKRGVFDATKDTYYRPVFLDSMILNYHLSEEDIAGYRLVNLLLHVLSVVFLFRLLKKLRISDMNAFLLSLIFAVHPVLSQAVVWIPGRNDTLMAVFLLPYFMMAIDFARTRKPATLAASVLLLLAAIFTKETALLAPAAAFVLVVIILRHKWSEKPMLIQYGLWAMAAIIYLAARSAATLQHEALQPSQMLRDFAGRIPLLFQYFGKILLPFNLSVFPVQQDTTIIFGLLAVILFVALVFFSQEKNKRHIAGGLLVFLIFLLPVMLVPNKLTGQAFEHRLYLPIIGVLIALSQTALFRNKLSPLQQLYLIGGISAGFAIINYNHQQKFTDPLTFWQSAAESSPHSAYAVMMYAARVEDKKEGYALMRRAYQLNPEEKYINYYYGVMLQNQDSVLESEKHFLKEQEISDYYECDFYLAQIDHKRQNLPGAEKHLERYITRDSMNAPANSNLLLLYLEEKKKQKAIQHISNMQRRGFTVPATLIQQAQALP